jgi:hypothetical protein
MAIASMFAPSILISLVIVLIGLSCYWQSDVILKGRAKSGSRLQWALDWSGRATIGGIAVAHAPVGYLKLFLGCVRIVAAAKTIASHRWGEPNVAADDPGTGPTFILR